MKQHFLFKGVNADDRLDAVRKSRIHPMDRLVLIDVNLIISY